MPAQIKSKTALIISLAIAIFFCLHCLAHAATPQVAAKSYTQLDQNGNPALTSAVSFAMIRDNDTGLIWEAKTDDSTIHNRDATWPDLTLLTDSFLNINVDIFGHLDWRIPTVEELVSIVKYDNLNGNGAFDETYFPNTQAGYYLAVNPDGENGGEPFIVDFISGEVSRLNPEILPDNIYWRIVREDNQAPEVRYIKPEDNIIVDTVTGLMWFINPEAEVVSQADALTCYCESLIYNDFNDWRLPDVKELASFSRYFKENQIQMTAWSSTKRAESDNNAWYVDLYTSEIHSDGILNLHNVIAVRGKPTDEKKITSFYNAKTHSLDPFLVNGYPYYEFKMSRIESPESDFYFIIPEEDVVPLVQLMYFDFLMEMMNISIPYYNVSSDSTGHLNLYVDVNNLFQSLKFDFFETFEFENYCIEFDENGVHLASIVDIEVTNNKLYLAGNLEISTKVFDREYVILSLQNYQGWDELCNHADDLYNPEQSMVLDYICLTSPEELSFEGLSFEGLSNQDLISLKALLGEEEVEFYYFSYSVQIPFLKIGHLQFQEENVYISWENDTYFPFSSSFYPPILQDSNFTYGFHCIDIKPISNDHTLIKAFSSDINWNYDNYYYYIYNTTNGSLKVENSTWGDQNVWDFPDFFSSIRKTTYDIYEYYELGKKDEEFSYFFSRIWNQPYIEDLSSVVQLEQDIHGVASTDNSFVTIENTGDNYKLGILALESLKNGDFTYNGSLLFHKEEYSFYDIFSTNEHAYLLGKRFVEDDDTNKNFVMKVDISDPENTAIRETIYYEALEDISDQIDGFSVSNNKIIIAYNNDGEDILVLEKDQTILEAEAGLFQSVNEGTTVILNGTTTYSLQGGNQFSWEQISGPGVEIENPNTASTSFVAPEVGIYGDYLTFRLTVTDGSGDQSKDTVTVYVKNENRPPEAVIENAGGIEADEQTLVELVGENSQDDDGIVTYLWKQVSGPEVEIIDPSHANAKFTAPDVGMDGATLEFRLTVFDYFERQDSETCTVILNWVNEPPEASAGSDIEANEGIEVQLNAEGSTDVDDGIDSYSWVQTDGTPVGLMDGDTARPHFTAPFYNPEGDLAFTLTVKDAHGLESTDECTVKVIDVTFPEKPAEFKSELVSRDSIRLIWTKSLSDDVSHYILYSNNGSGEIDFSAPLAILDSAETYYDITDLSDGSYKFSIRPQDHYGNIEQNEISLTSRNVQPICELEPGGFNIDQETIVETDIVQAIVVVNNSGDGTAHNVPVGIYRSTMEAENLIYSKILPEIPDSGSASFAFPYDTAGKSGDNTLYLVIDSQNEIFELNNENNTTSLSFVVLQRPDLYFQQHVQVSGDNFYEGSELTVTGTVFNDGNIEVNDVVVHFFLDNTEQINAFGEKIIATFAPGSAETVSINWNSNNFSGTRTVYAVIDLAETIGERNEDNNTSQFSMSIANPVITAVLKSPDNIEAGNEAEFEIQYSNSSSIDAENVFIDLNLPEGITINSSDTVFYNETQMIWNIGSVPAGAGGAIKFSIFVNYTMPDNSNTLWDIVLDYVNPNNIQMDNLTRSRNISIGDDVTAPGFVLNVAPVVISTGTVQIRIKSHEPLSGPPELTVKDSLLYPFEIRLTGEDTEKNEYTYEVEVDDTYEEGQVYIDVTGNDLSGNSGTSLAGFSIDRTPPEINIQCPEYGTGTINVSLTFNETLMEAPQISFTDISGTLIPVGDPVISGSEYLYHIAIPQDFQEGLSKFIVTAKDKAGNTASSEVNPILDLKDPGLTITAPESAGIGTFDFNIQIDEPIKGYPTVKVLDSKNMHLEIFSISSTTGRSYRAIVKDSTNNGNACITMTVEDLSGRKTTLQKCLYIDVTKPGIAIAADIKSKPDATIITVFSNEALSGPPEVDVVLGSGESVAPALISQSGDTYTYELPGKNIIHVYTVVEDTVGNRIANRVSLVDIAVLENSISFSSIPAKGDDVEITALIHNSSSSTNIENVKIKFIDAVSNNEIGSRIVDIPAGQTIQTSLTWTADLQQAQHLIYVYVDPYYEIFETDERNNIGLKGSYSLHVSNLAATFVDNLDSQAAFNVQVKRLADSSILDDSFVEPHFAIIDEDGNVIIENQPMVYNPSQSCFETSFDPSSLLDPGKYKMIITGEDTLGGNPIYLEKGFTVIDDFSVTISTDNQVVDRHHPVDFFGNVKEINGSAVENARVELYLNMRNGTRKFVVYTNETGVYSYHFTPSSSEAGHYTLTARAVVEGIQRETSTSFSILGLYLAPSSYNLSFSANDKKEKTFKIYNLGEDPITGLNVEIQDADKGDTVIASLDTTQTSSVINPGGKTTFKIIYESTSEEPVSNAEILTRVTTDQIAVETGKSVVTTKAALPGLNISKTYIETVLNPESTKREIITLTNTGYGTIYDLNINTEALPYWISINTEPFIGTLVARGSDHDYGFGLLPDYGLIGKIGENGETFYIGSSKTVTSDEGGELYVRVNEHESQLYDNTGKINIMVKNGETIDYILDPSAGWANTHHLIARNHTVHIQANGLWESSEEIIRNTEGMGASTFSIVINPDKLDLLSNDPYDNVIKLTSSNYSTSNISLRNWVVDSSSGDIEVNVSNIIKENVVGAEVTIYDQSWDPVSQSYRTYAVTTDENGRAVFEGIPTGSYKYMVRAHGHAGVIDELTVGPGVNRIDIRNLVRELVTVDFQVYELEEARKLAEEEEIELIGDDYEDVQRDRYEVKISTYYHPVNEEEVLPPVIKFEPRIIFEKVRPGELRQDQFVIVNSGDLTAFIDGIIIPESINKKGTDDFCLEINDISEIEALKDGLQPNESVTIHYSIDASYATFGDGELRKIEFVYHYFINSDDESTPYIEMSGKAGINLSISTRYTFLTTLPKSITIYNKCTGENVFKIGAFEEEIIDFSVTNNSSYYGSATDVWLARPLYIGIDPHPVATLGEWDDGNNLRLLSGDPQEDSNTFHGRIDIKSIVSKLIDLNLFPTLEIGHIGFGYQWDDPNENKMKYGLDLIPVITVSEGCIMRGIYETLSYLSSYLPESGSSSDSSSSWGSSSGSFFFPLWGGGGTPTPNVVEPKPAIKFELSHEITMERDLFLAQLILTNGLEEHQIEDFSMHIEISDESGNIIMHTQEEESPLWWFREPELKNITSIDGSGILEPKEQGIVEWLIVPKSDSGGEEGREYTFKVYGNFKVNGEEFTFDDIKGNVVDTINVKPQPKLKLDYYLPKNVKTDEPFYLILNTTNIGHGTARKVMIDENGTAVLNLHNGYFDRNGKFWFGCVETDAYGNVISNDPDCGVIHANFTFFDDKHVNGESKKNKSIKTDLGDIGGDNTEIVHWKLTSDHDGYFSDIDVQFSHTDLLGGRETSLIDEANIHYYDRIVNVFIEGKDVRCAFTDMKLIRMDTGDVIKVSPASGITVSEPDPYNPVMSLSLNKEDGFTYIDILNPYGYFHQVNIDIDSIITNSGQTIDSNCFWFFEDRIRIIGFGLEGLTVNFKDAAEAQEVSIEFDKQEYSGFDNEAQITVFDNKINPTPGPGNDTVQVTVATSLEPGGEVVELTESSEKKGKFTGKISFEDNLLLNNNKITVRENCRINATYTYNEGKEEVTSSAFWVSGSSEDDTDGDGVIDANDMCPDTPPDAVVNETGCAFSQVNHNPVAAAGTDQIADEGEEITLNGTNSQDPDDDILTYFWEQIAPETPLVDILEPTSAQTGFIAPDVDSSGLALTLKLTVTDPEGAFAEDECIVNVSWVNDPPIADAGEDLDVSEGEMITLDASASYDFDDGIVSYLWELKNHVLADQYLFSDPIVAFPAPDVGSENLTMTFVLTVTDKGGLQSQDEVNVNVTWVNTPPTADAGLEKTVKMGREVMLDGSGSFDLDDGIVRYYWEYLTGPPVTILTPDIVQPTFVAPLVDSEEELTFRLTVEDSAGSKSSADIKIIVVHENNSPIANAGGPYLAAPGTEILLDASGSYDPNQKDGTDPIVTPETASGYDEIVLYQWDLDSDGLYGAEDSPAEPEGIQVAVNFGDFIGNTSIALKVTDSFGNSSAGSIAMDTVAFSNIYPLSYELVTNRYNRMTGQWTVGYKVNIINAGDGSATDVTARLLPDSIPIGVTINEDTVSWTIPDNIIDSGEVQLSDNEFQIVYPRTLEGPDLSKITWELFYTDNLGDGYVVKSIPQ